MKDHPVFALISDQESIEALAGELADQYVEYFDVDTSHEEDKYQDAIEECLAHLEEVSSSLEDLMQNKAAIDEFGNVVDSKSVPLSKLYSQVDAIEQYMFETSKLLDQLDSNLTEMERHQCSKTSTIEQIIGMIPGMSTVPKLPSIFSNLIPDNIITGMSETTTEQGAQQQLIPTGELLNRIKCVEMTLSEVSNEFNKRLHGYIEMTTIEPKMGESMAKLSLESEGNVDGSWQELL